VSQQRGFRTNAHERQVPAGGVLQMPGQPTILFVTVCTQDRQPWLAAEAYRHALVQLWREEARAWLVGRYVLMPDHMHFFAAAADAACPFSNWMKFWKRRFCQTAGLQPRSLQYGEWDTRMRNAREYEEKWRYVLENPVRRGLATDPEGWPFQGEVHELRW
jgi:putative transposase